MINPIGVITRKKITPITICDTTNPIGNEAYIHPTKIGFINRGAITPIKLMTKAHTAMDSTRCSE